MEEKKKAKIAIICGTGVENLLEGQSQIRIGTPYGIAPPILTGKIGNNAVAILPRHGFEHSLPPHKINYRANICALYEIGIERIIAINAVGAINRKFKPGDFVIPHDFIDFTKLRNTTFYDEAPVTHVDFSQPYCPEMRKTLTENAKKIGLQVWDEAVLVCTEGPRFETPAEIEMFRRLGCDIVGMTGVPEVVLARELQICYASLCFVSNMAAGMQERLTPIEVSQISKQIEPNLKKVLTETISNLPVRRRCCPCFTALENSRIK